MPERVERQDEIKDGNAENEVDQEPKDVIKAGSHQEDYDLRSKKNTVEDQRRECERFPFDSHRVDKDAGINDRRGKDHGRDHIDQDNGVHGTTANTTHGFDL